MSLTLYRAGSIVTEARLYDSENARVFDAASREFGMKDSRSTSVYAAASESQMKVRWAPHRVTQELDSCLFRIDIPDAFCDNVYAYKLQAYEDWCQWRTVYEDDAASTLAYVQEYARSRVLASTVTVRNAYLYEVLIPRHVALQSVWFPHGCVEGCAHQEAFAAGDGFLYGVELEEVMMLTEARVEREEATAAAKMEREYRELFKTPALVGVSV